MMCVCTLERAYLGFYISIKIFLKIHVYSCHMGKTFLSIYKGVEVLKAD